MTAFFTPGVVLLRRTHEGLRWPSESDREIHSIWPYQRRG